jgi:putative acetyltransferase
MMQLQDEISPVGVRDYAQVEAVWEAAVRATHHFISEADIDIFRPLVRAALPRQQQIVCVRDQQGQVAGFVTVNHNNVDMLFITPLARGQGVGKKLLRYAVDNFGATTLDVNEQNEQALGFYLHFGFEVTSRSAVDGMGKPYPLLRMRLARNKRHAGATAHDPVD